MTETRATAYVLLLGGSRLCGRVAYGADGAPLFRPPPPLPAAPTAPAALRAAVAVAALAAASGCAEAPPPAASMPVEPARAVLAVAAPELAVASNAVDPSTVDSDKDGIADEVDACPYEPGTVHEDRYKNGCRTFVGIIVTQADLRIVERIQFAKGEATVQKTSDAVLGEIAVALKEHPEIKRVLIAGHAASDEPDAKRLSEKRAKAVMKALTASGVEAARLDTAGYGADHPIKESLTAEGRNHNRRVQFQIMDSSPPSF
jgi:OmpA-OmpF porin, OOP family